VRDLILDLALRSRLRWIIDTAVSADDPLGANRPRHILADADAGAPGWQAAAYDVLDDRPHRPASTGEVEALEPRRHPATRRRLADSRRPAGRQV